MPVVTVVLREIVMEILEADAKEIHLPEWIRLASRVNRLAHLRRLVFASMDPVHAESIYASQHNAGLRYLHENSKLAVGQLVWGEKEGVCECERVRTWRLVDCCGGPGGWVRREGKGESA